VGLNTTLFLLNDRLGEVRADTKLGELIYTAIQMGMGDEPQPVGHGVYVVETHHADDTVIIAFGGNQAKFLGSMHGISLEMLHRHAFDQVITRFLETMAGMPHTPFPLPEAKALRKHAKLVDFSNLPKETKGEVEDPPLTEASTEELNAEAKRRGFRMISLRRQGEQPKRLTPTKKGK
jgi:hypothetical protein